MGRLNYEPICFVVSSLACAASVKDASDFTLDVQSSSLDIELTFGAEGNTISASKRCVISRLL